MPDLQKRNILLKLLPKEVADPLIMHLKDYPTFNSLTVHALNTVDMLVRFHGSSRSTNLLEGADDDDDDWNEEDLQCLQCGDTDEGNQLQQILAMFKKKFGSPSNRQSPSGPRESRCGARAPHL